MLRQTPPERSNQRKPHLPGGLWRSFPSVFPPPSPRPPAAGLRRRCRARAHTAADGATTLAARSCAHGPARLGSTRHGSARLGTAGPGAGRGGEAGPRPGGRARPRRRCPGAAGEDARRHLPAPSPPRCGRRFRRRPLVPVRRGCAAERSRAGMARAPGAGDPVPGSVARPVPGGGGGGGVSART